MTPSRCAVGVGVGVGGAGVVMETQELARISGHAQDLDSTEEQREDLVGERKDRRKAGGRNELGSSP